MRFARLTGSMVAVVFACGVASEADALPLAGKAHAVTPIVQLAAHKPNEWYWNGHWWRQGPWSDHVVYGLVSRRGRPVMFVPWSADCAAQYRRSIPVVRGKCCNCR